MQSHHDPFAGIDPIQKCGSVSNKMRRGFIPCCRGSEVLLGPWPFEAEPPRPSGLLRRASLRSLAFLLMAGVGAFATPAGMRCKSALPSGLDPLLMGRHLARPLMAGVSALPSAAFVGGQTTLAAGLRSLLVQALLYHFHPSVRTSRSRGGLANHRIRRLTAHFTGYPSLAEEKERSGLRGLIRARG